MPWLRSCSVPTRCHDLRATPPWTRRYSEPEVNAVLERLHQDTARLRRDLVGFGFMEREGGGGDYWLTAG